jgi:hypothetical protein
MKAAALITGLFVLLAGAVCARAEPASKPQEVRQKELLGPSPNTFTKDYARRECDKKHCWTPVQLEHFQLKEKK